MKPNPIAFALVFLAACSDGGAPCDDSACTLPPESVCKDSATLLEYSLPGCCSAAGTCEYTLREVGCPSGCAEGRCAGEPVAGGTIALFEAPVQTDPLLWGTAYFAEQPHYRRSLIFQAPRFVDVILEEGDCILSGMTLLVSLYFEPCMPRCQADQECVEGACGGYVCRPLPAHWNAGPIHFEGLREATELTPDEFDRYTGIDTPRDLWDTGAAITARAEGSELGAFTMSATGPSPLTLTSSTVVTLAAGAPVEITWIPDGSGDRVRAVLLGGLHDPSLPAAALLCDVPDSQGRITISAALVDGFRARAFLIQKFSEIARYSRSVARPFGAEIEFIVASRIELTLERP